MGLPTPKLPLGCMALGGWAMDWTWVHFCCEISAKSKPGLQLCAQALQDAFATGVLPDQAKFVPGAAARQTS